jgi:hypothetical protein
MAYVGYQFVKDRLKLGILPIERPAAVGPVTRIERRDRAISVPSHLSPGEEVTENLLFALKHEGTNLSLIAAASVHLEPGQLLAKLRELPNGSYIRKLCLLWEVFTGRQLEDLPAQVGGIIAPLFDPDIYVTTKNGPRDKRWRVELNGLGNWDYCPTIMRTPALEALLAQDLLSEVHAFFQEFPQETLDRVLAWAYLDETRSSYAIEGETPSGNKAETFVKLLRKAEERRPLDEEYLITLQNAAMVNDWAREASFRQTQNHLSNGLRGAAGVTYVPPPADLLASLIAGQAKLADGRLAEGLDPLLRAALISFGFVFAHPFMDGNGRLSRFLAHYTLCQSGALKNGYILPLSTAMKRNESAYLAALQSFSAPARELWQVNWLDADAFTFDFRGHPSIYRYFDATKPCEFTCAMAQESLRHDLRAEVEFLHCYDRVLREVDALYDIDGSTLSKLIRMALSNGGSLSKHRRKQFGPALPAEVFDFIEERVKQAQAALAPQIQE